MERAAILPCWAAVMRSAAGSAVAAGKTPGAVVRGSRVQLDGSGRRRHDAVLGTRNETFRPWPIARITALLRARESSPRRSGIEAARVVERAHTAHELDPADLRSDPEDAVRAPRGQEADALAGGDLQLLAALDRLRSWHLAADSRLPPSPRWRRSGRPCGPRRARLAAWSLRPRLFFGRHREAGNDRAHGDARGVEGDKTIADDDDALADPDAVAAIDVEQCRSP